MIKLTLGTAELVALWIAEQAVRALPEKPCLGSFPFLDLLDLLSHSEESDDEEIKIVSFTVQMRAGCFDTTDSDRSSWPEFLFHLVDDDSGMRCKFASVQYSVSENEVVNVEFTVIADEEGNIAITKTHRLPEPYCDD